jgi:hypothetical protein
MDIKSMDPGRRTYRETTTNRVVHVVVLYCGHGSGHERSKIAIVVIALTFRAPSDFDVKYFERVCLAKRGNNVNVP